MNKYYFFWGSPNSRIEGVRMKNWNADVYGLHCKIKMKPMAIWHHVVPNPPTLIT